MRINGFEQIKGFYSWVFNNQDKQIRTAHISLYMFLLNQNNRNAWVEWFKCPYDLAMGGSGITNKKTYYKCLNDLNDLGLIQYKKGANNWSQALVKLEVLFDTSSVPQCEPQVLPETIPLPAPLVLPHLANNIKLLTSNLELITLNIEKVINFLNDSGEDEKELDESIYYLTEKEFLDDWNDARIKMKIAQFSNFNALYTDEKENFKELQFKYTKEQFKNGLRGLFMQKDLFESMSSRPNHFLSNLNIEKYIDAKLNDKQLYETKNKYDVKL